jgi:hypothetical protein
MGEWKIRRKIFNQPEIVFTFPKKFVLKPGKAVKIYARGRGFNLPPDQLVDDSLLSFGIGTNASTILVSKDGDVSIISYIIYYDLGTSYISPKIGD